MNLPSAPKPLYLSVRALVQQLFRSGSLGSGNMSKQRALAGIQGHVEVQGRRTDHYEREVSVVWAGVSGRFEVHLRGRIDGVYSPPEGVTIEEIKTTSAPLSEVTREGRPSHWAQAFLYAHMYLQKHPLEEVTVQLTYYNIESGLTKEFSVLKSRDELAHFFDAAVASYVRWATILAEAREARDASLDALRFPFPSPRDGQNHFMERVAEVLESGGQLFAEAPTGTGKTISVLYPALKVLGTGGGEKIFYLTAKTLGRQVVQDTLDIMRAGGLSLRAVTLTAKEKICFNAEVRCEPEECPWSKGHFDRLNAAVAQIFTSHAWRRELIEEVALEHRVCPFDLSLELASLADVVVCDYNYVYDPRVFLRHLFSEEENDYIFLVDEAHNLVDRAREMYSATISKESLLAARRLMKGYDKSLHRQMGRINTLMLGALKEISSGEGNFRVEEELPSQLVDLLDSYCRAFEAWLEKHRKKKVEHLDGLLEFYFTCLNFVQIAEVAKREHVTWYEVEKTNLTVRIYCLDPSRLLKERHRWARGAVLFSATLTPLDYFMQVLGGFENASSLILKSPFPQENLLLLIHDRVGTTWKKRGASYETVARAVASFTAEKRGNYLIFFPSYQYMIKVAEAFSRLPDVPNVVVQERRMSERDREAFLSNFRGDGEGMLAFAVMGGIFGEGIDLRGERLIGAVIVGVGLPAVTGQQNLIRDYFDRERGLGFQYAYQYPGFIRVMQSLGRVIRSSDERGAVLLIDERFSWSQYRKLFPDHWRHYRITRGEHAIKNAAQEFWGQGEAPPVELELVLDNQLEMGEGWD